VATSFASESTPLLRYLYHGPFKRLFTITPEEGAGELVWLAQGSPGATFLPGEYYESRAIATRVHPRSLDPELAAQLWEQSELLI
jgi:hypothetical protein